MAKKLLFALVMCLLVAGGVYAQENAPPADLCTDDGRAYVKNFLQQVGGALDTSENPDVLLAGVQAVIASYRADCANLVFTSDEYGADVVTDPIIFPTGIYRVTLTTDSRTTLSLEEISGNCPYLVMIVSENLGLEDHAAAKMESCVALLDISGRGNWTLTFEPIVVAGN